MATHQVLEKLELDLDAQGVTDPDFREFARVTVGKVLREAADVGRDPQAQGLPGKPL